MSERNAAFAAGTFFARTAGKAAVHLRISKKVMGLQVEMEVPWWLMRSKSWACGGHSLGQGEFVCAKL